MSDNKVRGGCTTWGTLLAYLALLWSAVFLLVQLIRGVWS